MHTLHIEGLAGALPALQLRGEEAISRPFVFEVTAGSEAPLAIGDLVGREALLTIDCGLWPRYVHGIVGAISHGDVGPKMATYEVRIVPDFERLAYRRDSRIFQQKSAIDIVKDVLGRAGIAGAKVRFATEGSHPEREYCVQYRETDRAFVERLLEEEGCFYFFEHSATGHVLVIGDAKAVHEPIAGDATVPFRPGLGALSSEEHVARFRFGEQLRSGKVTLRDYDFRKPTLSLEKEAEAGQGADLEVYDYPGDYVSAGIGAARAKIRLEEAQATRRSGRGDGACARFAAGATFTLSEHPHADLDRSYLLVSVEHRATEAMPGAREAEETGGARYENKFTVIPSDVPFRPERRTPKPRMHGAQTAVVVGPKGEEIHTDEHGRIKVQFFWDREGKHDEKSSCWMRVSQVWAGAAWGAVFLPRIGHEVVVDFLEGDPDRPLVVGSVYHGVNVPPYALPAEKTKSALKSESSVGGGGSNELRFEDKKGSEEVLLHAEKDLRMRTEHDKEQRVGHDETLSVGHDREAQIGRNHTEAIGGEKVGTVGKNHTETIAMNHTITNGMNRTQTTGMNETVSVGMNRMVCVAMCASEAVGMMKMEAVGLAKVSVVGGASTEVVGGAKTVIVAKDHASIIAKDQTTQVGNDATETVTGNKNIVAGKKLAIVVGSATITVEMSGDVKMNGVNITIQGTGPVTVSGATMTVKSDGVCTVQASGSVSVKGSSVAMN